MKKSTNNFFKCSSRYIYVSYECRFIDDFDEINTTDQDFEPDFLKLTNQNTSTFAARYIRKTNEEK